jgi:aspartyl-tRNA(Asn)/glutamyl-tRNA(Gln) amidotransferase subunit C
MLDSNQIKKIAKLAKIKIDEDQIGLYQTQINEILDFVEVLKEVDIENVDFSSFPTTNRMREDEISPSLENSIATNNSKKTLNGGFLVPSVLGKST